MIIFNDLYDLKNKNSEVPDNIDSICPVSCYLRIIDLSKSNPHVSYLKPNIVVAFNTTKGPVKTTCIETMGKHITTEFNLDIARTIWIEYDSEKPEQMYIAVLNPGYHDGEEIILSISWRPIFPNELKMIKPFIPEADNISKLLRNSG